MLLKYPWVIVLGFFMAMFIAACASPTTPGGGLYGSGNTSPPTATTGGSNSSTVLQTATVTVKGQSKIVLTNEQGKTLYYFTPDSATQPTCSSSCAQTWLPLLFTGSGVPTSSPFLPGQLSLQMDANGSHVEYNGHPLYTFSQDTAPGQTNGEGLFGMWFVATPNLPLQAG
jgi:predicted lipoprotein with Yx(FWY)xxD motif